MRTKTGTPRRLLGRGGSFLGMAAARGGIRQALLAAGVLAPPLAGWCLDPRDIFAVGAGPVVFHPTFEFGASYNDNIYYLPEDSVLKELGVIKSLDDFMYRLRPGFDARLGRPDGDNQLNFEFDFEQVLYQENTNSDSSNYTGSLSAVVKGAKLSYDCSNRLAFLNSILDSYTAVIEGIAVPSANIERTYLDLDHNLTYDLSPKTRLFVEGDFRLRDYPGSELTSRTYYNSQEWRGTGGFGYVLTERILLSARAYYGQVYSQPKTAGLLQRDDYTSDVTGLTVTANGSFTPKLTGSLMAGYEHKWISGAASGDDGYPVVGVSLTQELIERTLATLSYNHGGSTGGTGGSATVVDSFGLSFRHTLGSVKPWFLDLGLRYFQSHYIGQGGGDQDTLAASLGVTREFRPWLRVFANYTYEFGTRSGFDYDVNMATVGLHLGY